MPTSPVLARPTSITGLVLIAGTVGGGGIGTEDFFIKVFAARMLHRSRARKITGDGDLAPNWQINYFLTVDWLIRGWMVANQRAGIAKMILVANNPTADSTGTMVKFDLANQNTVTGRFVIEAIDSEWIRDAPYIGLSMRLKNTANADGTFNYTEDLT